MNSSTLMILSTKRFLITSVAIAIIHKLCVPIASLSEISAMWYAILSWLEPPYLYIVINCIIITIAASSRLHVSTSEPSVESTHPSPLPPPSSVFSTLPPEMVVGSSDGVVEEPTDEVEDEDEEEKDKNVVVEGEVVTTIISEDEGESTLSFYDAPPMQEIISRKLTESTVSEKPLVSTRFGHRRPIRTTLHEAAALRVARPKKQETLESTWKMVTEGRHVPLTRHLKTKSERWEHVKPDIGHVPKSETFKERTSAGSYNTPATTMNRVNGKIRKEPSLGQDELNRRVEAFIKKFNEEMRIQRQESLNRFMEMINRGV